MYIYTVHIVYNMQVLSLKKKSQIYFFVQSPQYDTEQNYVALQ